MKRNIYLFLTTSLLILSIISCVKREYDEPPAVTIPTGNILTISDLYQIYQDSVLAQGVSEYKFTEDYSVYAVVTMDDKLGNIYKTAYIQDGNNAMKLHMLSSGGLYQGDSIRIYLKGLLLMDYNGILQLDSVNVDKHIFKQATEKEISPKTVTITELNSHINDPEYLCKLVKLDSVQFANPNQTYADANNLDSRNVILRDIDLNEIIVRNSGYATFAGDSLPSGSGSIIAIMGKYGSDIQLYIRSTDEVMFDNPRFTDPYLEKNFDDGSITSGGWTQQNVIGSILWSLYGSSGDYVASISNYNNNVNTACETWLISPAMDLSSAIHPILTFRNAKNYVGPDLECQISVDYDGTSDPTTATWTTLSFIKSSGAFTFVNSGDIDLSNYISAQVYLAFKYTGSSSDGATWEVDDVLVMEN